MNNIVKALEWEFRKPSLIPLTMTVLVMKMTILAADL